MPGGQLARMLDDDAHAAGELEVLQDESDLQGAGYRTAALRPAAVTDRVPTRRAAGAGPYPTPPGGAPVRIAFVGQETYFRAAALTSRTAQLSPIFVDFRAGADPQEMLDEVVSFSPDVVIVFRPEVVPEGLFGGLRVPTLGFLTEPLPRGRGKPHPDLEVRLAETRLIDRANFDRIVSFDPLFVEVADPLAPVWRSVPLPVDDRFFMPVRRSSVPPKVMFIGRSTEHREYYLVEVKHRFDVVHMAHGVFGDRLLALLGELDVGINLHNEPYPSFENRVCLHLAAGNLVLSEALSPTHGLEPGIDYIEIRDREDLLKVVEQIHFYPDLYRRVRIRGRKKAEAFRASRVYPRVVHDLFLDIEVFGTDRPLS
jgi:hypothetical protein